MGVTINQLSQLNQLSGSDQLPVYSASNGDARKASLSTLLAYIESQFVSPDFQRVTASPTLAGFTVTLPSTANSLFLILTPTGTMATGTLVLPPAASAADGQEIVLFTSQEVTALTFTLNGAVAVNGAPTGIQAGASLTLRYDVLSVAWYTIETTGTSITSGTFTPVYSGAGITGTVTFSARWQRVGNFVSVEHVVNVAAASSLAYTVATDFFTGYPSAINPPSQLQSIESSRQFALLGAPVLALSYTTAWQMRLITSGGVLIVNMNTPGTYRWNISYLI
jgi:hypothetical protein